MDQVEYTQRVDGEGWEVPSGERYLIECCDCGLVHDFAFISHDGNPIGIAAQRNEEQTAVRRSLRIQRPPMLNERQTKQLVEKFMRRTRGGKRDAREGVREIINLVYVQGHRAGRAFGNRVGAAPAHPGEEGKGD